MKFSTLPPEINSAHLFAGAGSAPMRAAAAGWNGLASELGMAANWFGSVTTRLVGESWQGPAATAMASAAAPYVGWLTEAAAKAETVAAQAKATAAAFETARMAVVHPGQVAANRTQVVRLVTTNVLGQNAPAIAAAEAEYDQMWAQDVAAMADYHGEVSAAVSQLTPWHQAPQSLGSGTAQIANTGSRLVVTPF